ncbi:MAG: hypothetical protein SGJ21_17390 [Alphaproteobacteria bacterium]|nr:hypothetical protein [Alphaproteobacteria bacterium]
MDDKNQNDIGQIDAEIAAEDGLMGLVMVLVIMGGVIVAAVSALIGAL